MMQFYSCTGNLELLPVNLADSVPDQVIWIDLLEPTDEEEAALEHRLGLQIPTREEMEEIEESSRLYKADGALYMTVVVVTGATQKRPTTSDITFVLTPHRLITVRYADPKPFQAFVNRRLKLANEAAGSGTIFISLLEAIIDRAADLLEAVDKELAFISDIIFETPATSAPIGHRRHRRKPQANLQIMLKKIGQQYSLLAKLRESLLSISRLLPFFKAHAAPWEKEVELPLKTLGRDVRSLVDYEIHQSSEITFLLEATLGLINIEQNQIIKVFSIAAVLFLPPTLVGTMYGMNFEFMPELHWPLGYPMAVLLMIISGVISYGYFKYRGYL